LLSVRTSSSAIANWDLCSPDYPCEAGQGDCDRNSDCASGLICRAYDPEVAPYGLQAGLDICIDPTCPAFSPGDPASDPDCILPPGQGDCDRDSECGGRSYCLDNVGAALHHSTSPKVDVCVYEPAAECPDYDPNATDWSFCSQACPCQLGMGDCDFDADCVSGLVCGQDLGASFGKTATLDMCVFPQAVPPGQVDADCQTNADCASGMECCVGGASSPSCNGQSGCSCHNYCD
jgi:hypothetical protein